MFQVDLDTPQGWKVHSCPGQLVPVPHCPQGEKNSTLYLVARLIKPIPQSTSFLNNRDESVHNVQNIFQELKEAFGPGEE